MRDERGDLASGQDASRSVLGLWIVLVTVLLLMGVAGASSFELLLQVTRMPTAADIAERVCTAYTTQNYQLLVDQIDPAPVVEATTTPGEISSNGSFDTTAKNQLIGTLKDLDKTAGIVKSCKQHQIVFQGSAGNPGSVQFVFLMQRAGTSNGTSSGTYSSLMNFVQHSGTWMVARDSNFIGTLQ